MRMMNASDAQLLQRYVKENSEAAFADLVKRHFDLVYSAATRQVAGDSDLARDIAQTVFADLARKARSLADRNSLAGWLYTSTHYAAAKVVRGERRRRAREEQAVAMHQITASAGPDWDQLSSTIDRAMQELEEQEREALLLRFFKGCEFRSVGEALGVSEDAARKRVERTLEKLRNILGRHGLTSTAGSLAAVLSANAVSAAPAGLATSISATAVATTGASTSLSTVLNAISASRTTVSALSAVALVAVVTPMVLQQRTIRSLRDENVRMHAQLAKLNEAQANAAPATQADVDAAELERLRGDHRELLRLRSEVGLLRQQAKGATANGGAPTATGNQQRDQEPAPPFASVSKEMIPSRYRFIEADDQGRIIKDAVVTLHQDGSFTNPDGERGGSYKWHLDRQGLMLSWRTGIMLFSKVAAPGVYLAVKENNYTVRIEKIGSQ